MLSQNLTHNALSTSRLPKTVWQGFASLCHYRIMAKRAGVVGCQEISSKQ